MFTFRDPATTNDLLFWKSYGGTDMVHPTDNWRRDLLIALGEHFDLNVLVETGTYKGNMPAACQNHFDEIWTIELSDDLYQKATERFKNAPNVHCVHGSSGAWLPNFLPTLVWASPPSGKRVLFWLDAHCFGDNAHTTCEFQVPLELAAIAKFAPDSFVVVDDVKRLATDCDRCSVTSFRGYPCHELGCPCEVSHYLVDQGYPFDVPGWQHRFFHGVLLLHRGGYDL
jgi:hypothetical protein